MFKPSCCTKGFKRSAEPTENTTVYICHKSHDFQDNVLFSLTISLHQKLTRASLEVEGTDHKRAQLQELWTGRKTSLQSVRQEENGRFKDRNLAKCNPIPTSQQK